LAAAEVVAGAVVLVAGLELVCFAGSDLLEHAEKPTTAAAANPAATIRLP
jgi:hypothetical protein